MLATFGNNWRGPTEVGRNRVWSKTPPKVGQLSPKLGHRRRLVEICRMLANSDGVQRTILVEACQCLTKCGQHRPKLDNPWDRHNRTIAILRSGHWFDPSQIRRCGPLNQKGPAKTGPSSDGPSSDGPNPVADEDLGPDPTHRAAAGRPRCSEYPHEAAQLSSESDQAEACST